MPPTQQTKSTKTDAPKTETTRQRAGRQPVEDPDAPHGRNAQGQPNAPYGLLGNGKPRRYPAREAGKLGKAMLAQPMAVTEDVAEAAKPARARSDEQQEMDKRVADLYRQWVAKGKPNAWKELPKLRYDVDPDLTDDLKFIIRKAATFCGVRVRFGKEVRTTEGKAVVIFAAMAKTEKSDKK